MAPVVEKEAEAPITSIAVIFAMAAEAAPFVEHLKLDKKESSSFPPAAPWQVFSGSHDDITIYVVTPGKDKALGVDNVGTVPCAVLAYAVIEAFKPDLVINAGTAGGFKAKGAAIGDVYIATHFANHDRRIPLPGFDVYGIGLIEAPHASATAAALGLKEGRVSSGNSFDMTDRDSEIIKSNQATVKDMESAAIAWVTHTLNVPFIGLKSVTDIVDGDRPTPEEFLENLHSAAQALQRALPHVISFVGGKRLSEL